jgi:L-asparaginase II
MRTLRGAVVSKAGAEGMHATAFLAREIGIAVKIADGDAGRRAIKPAVVAVLDQLALLSPGDEEALLPREERVIRSYSGIPAGEILPAVDLTRMRR